jgi:hypothetical protein
MQATAAIDLYGLEWHLSAKLLPSYPGFEFIMICPGLLLFRQDGYFCQNTAVPPRC